MIFNALLSIYAVHDTMLRNFKEQINRGERILLESLWEHFKGSLIALVLKGNMEGFLFVRPIALIPVVTSVFILIYDGSSVEDL